MRKNWSRILPKIPKNLKKFTLTRKKIKKRKMKIFLTSTQMTNLS